MSFFLSDLFENKPLDEKYVKKEEEKPKPQPVKLATTHYEDTFPGTAEWMAVWRDHPELQQEMLEYTKKHFVWCPDREQRICIFVCLHKQEKEYCKCR